MGERQVLADRVHRFAAPRWVVFKALTDESDRRDWLDQAPGEVEPAVLTAVEDRRVVWTSLWPVSPDDLIEFDLERDGPGTAVRFRWLSSQPPDHRGIAITRQRLNYYLGGCLRGWVDSRGSPVAWDRPPLRTASTDPWGIDAEGP